MRSLLAAVSLLVALSGCPTTFSGNANVHGGRAGCEQKCKKAKLRMSALVYLGEYSSACVCEVAPPAPPGDEPKPEESAPPPATSSLRSPALSAGALGAAVGVALNAPADPEARPPGLKW